MIPLLSLHHSGAVVHPTNPRITIHVHTMKAVVAIVIPTREVTGWKMSIADKALRCQTLGTLCINRDISPQDYSSSSSSHPRVDTVQRDEDSAPDNDFASQEGSGLDGAGYCHCAQKQSPTSRRPRLIIIHINRIPNNLHIKNRVPTAHQSFPSTTINAPHTLITQHPPQLSY